MLGKFKLFQLSTHTLTKRLKQGKNELNFAAADINTNIIAANDAERSSAVNF